jgi:hypothetical protein
MAVAARDMAVESFNALAQLDSFIWGFLKAQKACTWKVGAGPHNTQHTNLYASTVLVLEYLM